MDRMVDAAAGPLAVTMEDGLNLDGAVANAFGLELSGQYAFAEPFPHIVIDNFLPLEVANAIHDRFPAQETVPGRMFDTGYAGHHKRQVPPSACDGWNRALFAFFNAAPMLQFLEGLSSIPKLVSDPYYEGGGFHEIFAGGKLGVHADFRIQEALNLQRRLNLLVYLNKDWDPAWGGELELWDRQMQRKVKSVAPLFNRCVVFSTDADSYHGHPDPLACPPARSRRSLALYYYTASPRVYQDVPANSTIYQARPTDAAEIQAEAKRLRQEDARRLRRENLVRDWLPPVAVRGLRALQAKLRREQ